MNKMLSVIFRFIGVVVWLAGCGAPQPLPNSIRRSTPTVEPQTLISARSTTPQPLPISTEASEYLEQALDIMQENSLYRERINWENLRRDAFELAMYAQTPADTYGAIRFVLSQIGDRHSSFYKPDEVTELREIPASENLPPRGKLLLEKIGFIAIERFLGFEGDTYATDVHNLIREIDVQQPCGWIVDLRENKGGNMWPMLAGIGPILGEGEAGAFVDAHGRKEVFSYQKGQSLLAGQVQVEVNGPVYRLQAAAPPVAVLTGVNTASSGEAIAVSFRGRPNTRSFGLYTLGLSTANQSYPLSDGAMINLTVSVFADRTGRTYGDRIYPDQLVEDVDQFTFLLGEAIPQPAIDWLMSQPACRESN